MTEQIAVQRHLERARLDLVVDRPEGQSIRLLRGRQRRASRSERRVGRPGIRGGGHDFADGGQGQDAKQAQQNEAEQEDLDIR